MTDMFYLFVQEGFFTPSKTNKFYFTYLLALKNEIMKTSKKINSENLIPITWSMLAMETLGQKISPLIPKLFELLYNFSRPEKPLTQDELIQLYQID